MSASVTLKASGLVKQPNQLDPQSTPPGSLTVASNVIIKRDNVIESRRGYKLYGTAMSSPSDRAKQLMTYKGRILRHYSNKLEFDTLINDVDGNSIFNAFAGNYLEPQTGRRIRFIEANGNFYFTTDQGIKKISAKTAADFTTSSGFITQAGGIKALDVSANLQITLGNQSGFLPQDSAVAYRIVWGIKDNNNNLILGTPSQRVVIFNPLLNLMIPDFNRLLIQLDNVSNNSGFPSLISDANYVSTYKLPITTSANELLTNLKGLVAKLDTDILYADNVASAPLQIASAAISGGACTVTFSSGDPRNYVSAGSHIKLSGFSPAVGTLNGPQVVATATANTLVFNTAATGLVTLSGPLINNYEYEFLTPPSDPSTPATDQQLVNIQTYLQNIITQLQSEPSTGTPPTISTNSQSNFISILELTTTANVILNITIPQNVTANNFYQVYRSDIASATGVQVLATDVAPNDELKLVFEGFPTSTDLSNGYVILTDETPDQFRGANLYTNSTTGEGILQSNDLPPFALDINRFKNVVFYANTRTRFRQTLSLLGVQQMITDYNNSITPKITISNGTITNTYKFVTGLQEITHVVTVADVAGSLAGKYFTINNANDVVPFYVWYKVSGTGTDPAIAGKVGIRVDIITNETANNVAKKTTNTLSEQNADFIAVNTGAPSNVIDITNFNVGSATDATSGNSGFTVTTTQQGRGEDVTTHQVLLSNSVSPAQAVDQTARSLVHIINRNPNESIYAFYLSGSTDVPGKILLESRTLNNTPFYILANDTNTGSSFNPDISPDTVISTISMANPTVITTSTPHGLLNQNQVVITNSNSTPSVDGLYTITYISPTSFSIPVNVTVSGNQGALKNAATTLTADNEVLPNRIYYSKLLQPEAVPIVNTIDVGAKDKAILRIFPLRDSLFVYKEDGLFRISGEVIPFNLALFDGSCILLAPDSLDISNNLLYGWSTQGIIATSESGVNIVSRPIDIDILKLATSQYVNFKSATWGMGYESDNSYTVYTIQQLNDVFATIGYRYSTLTNTWTTFDKTDNCGVIDPVDDTQYLGAGDTNFLEQERKHFTRLDYADREFVRLLLAGNYYGNQLQLTDLSNIVPGDVVTQDQLMSIYGFNDLLLKFDSDAFLSPHTYVTNNTMLAGNDPRIKLDALITQLAADPGRTSQAGFTAASSYNALKSDSTVHNITAISASNPTVITSAAHGLTSGRLISITGSDSVPSINGNFQITVLTANTFTIPFTVTQPGTTGTFQVLNNNFTDIEASYNRMIFLLNNDPGVAFGNYEVISTDVLQEAIVTAVNVATKKITLNRTLDFMVGPLTVYKAIDSKIQWAPQTFNDPLGLKHIREATIMFENKAFTNEDLSFSSDLLPSFQTINFHGTGNGIFGFDDFGYNFFGGASNSPPFRTYIPRQVQRCRFLNVQFHHLAAREIYAIYGITLVGEIGLSSRAFR